MHCFARWHKSAIRNPQSAMHKLAKLDHAHVWHPFTQMRDWLRREPIVIVAGKGAILRDAQGKEYLDANASIWTNLHGHNHPKINAAIQRQLRKVAHSSALGLANEPAAVLAAQLIRIAKSVTASRTGFNPKSEIRNPKLRKVFFSDDGSTALEVALKLAYEFARRTRGPKSKPRSSPWMVPITATPWARFRSATLTCSIKLTAGCCSSRTR